MTETEATQKAGFRGWLEAHRRLIISLIGVSLVPLLYAGALIWVNHDPTGHLDKVPAAVVNLDRPATTSDGDELNLGPDIVDEVVDNDDSSNLDWKEQDQEAAEKALRKGDVQAVMTIPKGFSAAAASAGDEDPSKAHATQVQIRTNDASNYLMGTISKTVGQEITNSIREQVTDTYLKNLYVGFTDIHENVGEAADGSKKLSRNTSKAHDSSGDLVVGLDELADGTVQLRSGTGELALAAGKLDSGAGTLDSGLSTLKDKTADLPKLSGKLDDGAKSLHSGVKTMGTATGKLADGADQLDSSTTRMADSASALPSATEKLADGSRKVSDGNAELASKAKEMDRSVHRVTGKVESTLDSLDDLLENTEGLSASTPVDVAGAAGRAKGQADRVLNSARMKEFLNQPGNEDLKKQLNDLKSQTSEAAQGAEQTRDAIRRAERSAGIVKKHRGTSIDDLRAGTKKVNSAAETLTQSTSTLADGAEKVAQGNQELAKQAPQLADGARKLSDATGSLASGTSELDHKVPQLVDGAGALSQGTGQLKSSVPTLTDAVDRLSDGASTLHGGTGELKSATAELAGAGEKLASGAAEADDGSKQLEDGLGRLSDGAKDLESGLKDGVEQIPDYSDDDQDHLATVNSTPVSSDVAQHHSMGNYGTGLSPYFMSLALWIGGIGFFMLMAPLTERLLATRMPAPLVALRAAWAPAIMAVVQAALVMVVVQLVIGIEMAHPVQVWLLASFASLAFLMVNQGLIAILGAPGRFASLILVVVQVASAGGTYPVQTMPDFLQAVRSVLPMTYTTQAFRSLVAGGAPNGVASCVVVLAIWMVVGFGLLVAAVFLARRSDSVRDWATLAPGRPNGGRPVPAAVETVPDAAEPEPEPAAVGAVAASAGRHTATDTEAAPAVQESLTDELMGPATEDPVEPEPAPEQPDDVVIDGAAEAEPTDPEAEPESTDLPRPEEQHEEKTEND